MAMTQPMEGDMEGEVRVHPAAALFPMLADGELRALAADIVANGLRNPIVRYEGAILDGRNRLAACAIAGVEPDYVEYEGDSPTAYVVSVNLQRRHLSTSQRAAISAEMRPLFEAEAHDRMVRGKAADPSNNCYEGRSLQQAADLMNVSHMSAHRAATVQKAAPEVFERVKAGDISVNLAAQVAELPEEDRQAVAEAPPEEVREVARDAVRKAHVSYNSGNNEWYTPAEIVEAARAVLGGIDLDPASTEAANEVVQATTYYTAEQDGLTRPWAGRVWLNPPYASGLIERFTEKLWEEVIAGRIEAACVLTNNATETKWFATLASVASAVCFPEGRVKFWSPGKDSATPLQGQAVIYVGDNEAAFSREFEEIGTVWIKSVARSVIGNAHLN